MDAPSTDRAAARGSVTPGSDEARLADQRGLIDTVDTGKQERGDRSVPDTPSGTVTGSAAVAAHANTVATNSVDAEKSDKSNFASTVEELDLSNSSDENDDPEDGLSCFASWFVEDEFPIDRIKPARDNACLYDSFGSGNADDAALMRDIRERGIVEPLVVSTDDVLLSGHRRLAAARRLRLSVVPVRRHDIIYESLPAEERLVWLRRFNRQREKTTAERLREELLEVDPRTAHAELRRRRLDTVLQRSLPKSNVELGAARKRKRIMTRQFLEAVQKVIQQHQRYWPLTDRRVHYLLLNDPPLRHDAKPGSRYRNDQGSYKALTNLLTRARLNGDVPFHAIEDPTRPITESSGFEAVAEFVKQETERFLHGYRRDLMQGQPHHVEVVLEKAALRSIVEEVASEYGITVTTGRGYSSLGPRGELASRFRRSGRASLVILFLTDFDPDGEEIAASFARSMRDDFGLPLLRPIKVALTSEDVEEWDLPSDLEAKESSPNYRAFISKHGTRAVELDSAPVELLQSKLRAAIESVIDIDLYNGEVWREEEDAAEIEALRRLVSPMLVSAFGKIRG